MDDAGASLVANAIAHRAACCPPNAIVTHFGAERASARVLRGDLVRELGLARRAGRSCYPGGGARVFGDSEAAPMLDNAELDAQGR